MGLYNFTRSSPLKYNSFGSTIYLTYCNEQERVSITIIGYNKYLIIILRMTRHIEPTSGGSSSRTHPSLPIRSPAGVSPDSTSTANENDDGIIQEAINTGKSISGLIAEILQESSLADNEESNLHLVLSLAEDLRNYQSPVEFTIGLIGDSGVGTSDFFYVEAPRLTFLQVKAV